MLNVRSWSDSRPVPGAFRCRLMTHLGSGRWTSGSNRARLCWELCFRIASVQRSNWRLSMAFAPVIPGQQDVNDAYSSANLPRTKREFQTLKESGQYNFGALMPWFCGLNTVQTRMWQTEVDRNYPPAIRREVERVVEAALLYKDEHGREIPIPIKWSWDTAGQPSVVTTFDASDPTKPFYSIKLVGCRAPDASSFFTRPPRRGLGGGHSEEKE